MISNFLISDDFMKKNFLFIIAAMFSLASKAQNENTWIRINQMGYIPGGIKVGVWCSKENKMLTTFQLVDAGLKYSLRFML